jgi:hypothetical protein
MGRNYLWHHTGDAANAVLAAVGYNFRRLIRWLGILLRQMLAQLTRSSQAEISILHGRLASFWSIRSDQAFLPFVLEVLLPLIAIKLCRRAN